MATTVSDPLIGHLVDGRYEVVSRIARGGMATVYLATDRRLDREVALKIMHPHLADGVGGAEFVARFRREARAAARLTHPGVVAVYDQGVDGETSYLTMEYVDGTNLRRRLAEVGALSVGEALTTTAAVLDALAAAHRADLVHRDIKPENVLLSSEERVKVADFGLARAVTEVTSTTTGTVLGTVAYLAPELVAHGSSDARTDVYAVGILLYEMLTGSQPFTGATPIQVAYQHVNSDVPAPSDVVDWLPVEVDELVQALAAREPAERPPHAGAALELVRRVRAGLDDATLDRRADVAPSVVLPQATDDVTGAARPADDASADDDPDATTRLVTSSPEAETRTLAIRVGAALEGTDDDAATSVTTAVTTVPGEHAWRRRVAVLLSVVAVLAVGGIVAVWYAVWGPGAYTTVPSGLVGVEVAAAEERLTGAGLGSTVAEDFHPDVPKGTVVATDPAPGESVHKEGSVELLVSLGPDLRVVPDDVVGAALEDAVTSLEDVGLVASEASEEHHDEVPEGHVIAMSAEPGEELPVDSEVALTVSLGPAPVQVQSVLKLPLAEATELLEDDGLVVEVGAEEYTEEYEEYPEGTVLAQSPEPAAEARRTDTVTLTVSLGAPVVAVPDVQGRDVEEARTTLRDAGFAVEIRRTFPWDRVVVGQDPGPNAEARKGATVVLTLG